MRAAQVRTPRATGASPAAGAWGADCKAAYARPLRMVTMMAARRDTPASVYRRIEDMMNYSNERK